MTISALNKKIKALPPEKRKEVELFIDNLSGKPALETKKQREFGFFRGKIKISRDFDLTPKEFQNYL